MIGVRPRLGFASTSAMALLAGLCCGSPARGQDAGVLDEVIVTAQKRGENLQNVPVSVTAIDGAALAVRGTADLADLRDQIPNLSFATVGSRTGVALLSIRGVGASLTGASPRVSVFVDDVPVSDQFSLASSLFDIDKVQVFRGPQSTLYGLTAIGGVVDVRSRLPDATLRGSATADVRSDPVLTLTAGISGPLVGANLAAALAGSYAHDPGDIRNVVLADDHFNEKESYALRAQLRLRPMDRVDLLAVLEHQEIDDPFGEDLVPFGFGATRGRAALIAADPKYVRAGITRLGERELAQDFQGFGRSRSTAASFRVQADIGLGQLVGVTSFRRSTPRTLFDINQAPGPAPLLGPAFPLVGAGNDRRLEETFHELRMVSSGQGDLTWLVGVSVDELNDHENGYVVGVLPSGIQGQRPFGVARGRVRQGGVFGQASYKLMDDRLTLTGGLRYGWASSRAVLAQPRSPLITAGSVLRTDEGIWLGRAVVDWRAARGVLLFGSVSTGWLPGGVNLTGSFPDRLIFRRETATSYEVGAKTTLFEGRVRLNAALFHTTIEDYQDFVRFSPTQGYLGNVPEVRFVGGEVEGQARFGRLELSASLGYAESTYRDFTEVLPIPAGPVVVDYRGKRLPGRPRLDYALTVRQQVTDSFFVEAGLVGQSGFYENQDRANVLAKAKGHTVFNVRAGLEKDPWVLSAYVNNLTDARYFTGVQNQLGDGFLYGQLGPGLEVGANLRLTFP